MIKAVIIVTVLTSFTERVTEGCPHKPYPKLGRRANGLQCNLSTVRDYIQIVNNELAQLIQLQTDEDKRHVELLLKKAFIKVNEAKKKMQLARKNRKMTRALLVSEVAN